MSLPEKQQWLNRFHNINNETSARIVSVVDNFFEVYDLPQIKELLLNELKLSLLGTYSNSLLSKEQDALLLFNEKLFKFLGAVYSLFINKETLTDEKTSLFAISEGMVSYPLLIPSIVEKGQSGAFTQIVKVIITLTTPQKIFLLGIYKNEESEKEWCFDFLVLVTPKQLVYQNTYKEVIQFACKDIGRVQLSFAPAEEVYLKQQKGHIYYSLVLRKGNLIYDLDKVPLRYTDTFSLKEITSNAKRIFQKNFARAQVFFDGARHFYLQNENTMSAYMLNRAALVSIKAMLMAITRFNYLTNDLQQLLFYSQRVTTEFQDFIKIDKEKNRTLFYVLQKASERVRENKFDIEVEEDVLTQLFSLVDGLMNLSKKNMKRWLAEFNLQ